jgi:hypothetical protein
MSLMITILSETGTLPNGRPRLSGQSFHVSPVRDFTYHLAEVARFGDEYTMLDADCTTVEIDPEGLLDLTIEPSLNMINGECFDGNSEAIEQLALAQDAARGENVRVMIETGF